MNIKNAPCYKCELRTVGCHSKCDKYKLWKIFINKTSDNISKNKCFIGDRVNRKNNVKCGVYRTTKK